MINFCFWADGMWVNRGDNDDYINSHDTCAQCGRYIVSTIYWEGGCYSENTGSYYITKGDDDDYQAGNSNFPDSSSSSIGNLLGNGFCSAGCRSTYFSQHGIMTRGEKERRREQAERERQAQAARERERQAQKEKEEHEAMLAKCVLIDGAYYSPDKTTLIEVDKMVRRLVVPEGVIEIGNRACKECSQLKSVTLPESLEEIEEGAFVRCSALTSITLPKNLKKLCKWAFDETGLESIVIPGNVDVGDAAFISCTALKELTISDNATISGTGVFKECESLKEVKISPSAKITGNYIFSKCKSLKEVTIPEGFTEVSTGMFYDCTALTKVNLPSSVKIIRQEAFKNCTALSEDEITKIMSSVEEIEGGAFEGTSVSKITIPANLKKIGSYSAKVDGKELTRGVFACCSSLKTVVAERIIGEATFTGCANLNSVTLPNKLAMLRWGVFKGCKSLESIKLPDGFKTIKGSVFSGCEKLAEITIPPTVTEIGQYAFNECKSLKTLSIPSGVTKLEKSVVEDCKALETFIIPSTITEIAGDPFKGCKSLKTVCIEGETEISSEVLKKLKEYAEKDFGKGTVKIKTGTAAIVAKNLSAGIGTMLGNVANKIKENDEVKKTISSTKDTLKKAFGGLFGKK